MGAVYRIQALYCNLRSLVSLWMVTLEGEQCRLAGAITAFRKAQCCESTLSSASWSSRSLAGASVALRKAQCCGKQCEFGVFAIAKPCVRSRSIWLGWE